MLPKKQTNRTLLCFALLGILYAVPVYGNFIWPSILYAGAIYSTWFLIFISIIIEALFLHYCIKDITYLKALLMSCVGNLASSGLGTLVTGWGLWRGLEPFAFENWFFFNLQVMNLVVIPSLMCLISFLIELATLRLIFRYPTKKLLFPVLVGNITTYALTALYFYFFGAPAIFTSWFSY